jgi:hypothetical protein
VLTALKHSKSNNVKQFLVWCFNRNKFFLSFSQKQISTLYLEQQWEKPPKILLFSSLFLGVFLLNEDLNDIFAVIL